MCVFVGRKRAGIFLTRDKFVQRVLPGCVHASAVLVLVQGRALATVISVGFLFMLKTVGKN